MENFLDMYALYHQFFNTKHIEKVDYYLTYLQAFDRLYEIPKNEKGETYVRYVESLVDLNPVSPGPEQASRGGEKGF